MRFAVIGSGSWATALAKLLTDNKHEINWWVRKQETANHIKQRHHNPNHLSSVYFDSSLVNLYMDINEVVRVSDCLIIAVPSAYIDATFNNIDGAVLKDKKIISAVKGILPENNLLLNQYLEQRFNFPLSDYFTVMGPCHAEEVASEKLSFLTFSGIDAALLWQIAGAFKTEDRKSTRLNSSHGYISYAVFCLK